MRRLAVIQVRGIVGMSMDIKDTLNMLRLFKKNCCSLVTDSPVYLGMLNKVRDYITWGEVDKDVVKLLLQKRGRVAGNKALNEKYLKENANTDFDKLSDDVMNMKRDLKDVPGLKRFFRLLPPKKGFGGIKKPYSMGGALGYRKNEINDLIRRMI